MHSSNKVEPILKGFQTAAINGHLQVLDGFWQQLELYIDPSKNSSRLLGDQERRQVVRSVALTLTLVALDVPQNLDPATNPVPFIAEKMLRLPGDAGRTHVGGTGQRLKEAVNCANIYGYPQLKKSLVANRMTIEALQASIPAAPRKSVINVDEPDTPMKQRGFGSLDLALGG